MIDKTLASFQTEKDVWSKFQALAKSEGLSASKAINLLIDRAIESGAITALTSQVQTDNAVSQDDLNRAIANLRDELLGKSIAVS